MPPPCPPSRSRRGRRTARARGLRSSARGLMDDDGVFRGPDGEHADVSLAEFLLGHLRRHAAAQKIAQVCADSGDAWSFRTLLTETVQIATALAEDGFGVGDTMAVFSRNYMELYSAVLGCIMAGVTVATMVPTHGPAELRHQMLLCSPKGIFVEAELLSKTEEALVDFPSEVKIFTLQSVDNADHVTSYQTLSERGFSADPDTYSPAEIPDRSNHAAFILYSSGTTGLPKGVQIPNQGITTMSINLKAVPVLLDLPDSTVLMLSPISWISGVLLLIKATELGSRRVSMPNPTPRTVVSSLQKYKVDLWPSAPPVLISLVQHPALRMLNFSSLKAIMSGGGPLGADLQREVAKKLNCAVVQGYGSTEAGIILTTTIEENRDGALGKPGPLVAVRLVDLDTGEVVREVGRVGELRIRSPCTMIGYIGNPEATAECYDDEGWFKSGDLLSFDADGYFYYVDRLKEMIKYKSHQVAPTEVEAVLISHPGVKDACVMGVPNLLDGEHPMAFVVKSKKSVTEEELQEYIAEANFALQLKGWRENMENFCGSKPPEGGCGSRQAQGFYPLWQPTASVFHGNRRFADCDPIAQFDRFDPRTTIGLPLEATGARRARLGTRAAQPVLQIDGAGHPRASASAVSAMRRLAAWFALLAVVQSARVTARAPPPRRAPHLHRIPHRLEQDAAYLIGMNLTNATRDIVAGLPVDRITLVFDGSVDTRFRRLLTVSMHLAGILTQTYSISTQIQMDEYIALVRRTMLRYEGMTSIIFCSRKSSEKLIGTIRNSNLIQRNILYMFYFELWPPSETFEGALQEAMRVAVISNPRPGTYRIYYTQATPEGSGTLKLVNWWSCGTTLFRYPVLPPASKIYTDLRGRTLHVPVLHKPPWNFVTYTNKTFLVEGGRDHELLLLLAEKLHFRFDYFDPPERSQGSAFVETNGRNKTFPGILGLISERRADLALGDITITFERSQAVEFSCLTLADSGAFVTKTPQPAQRGP
ncbi:Luciferin 4-monooxygenase [Frankliniella fusca]|uniref:Luciferin 4-monooxygenase n=1 Tax=Frankliniella fusca TaxID=407009 RepID=A0AAE1LKA2_9NEOP|nr:Luciferin 4-monooxygenase [Frankliniella fusca]